MNAGRDIEFILTCLDLDAKGICQVPEGKRKDSIAAMSWETIFVLTGMLCAAYWALTRKPRR
jgi:hypothetical protein